MKWIFRAVDFKKSWHTKNPWTIHEKSMTCLLLYPINIRKTPLHVNLMTNFLVLQIKSMDWFLYDRELRHERVKQIKIYLAWKNKALFFLGWRKLFTRKKKKKKNTVIDYRTKSNSCFATPDWDYIHCRSFSKFVSFISVKITVEPIKIWNNQNILYCKFRSTLYRNLKWKHLSRIEEMKGRKSKPF